MTRRLFLVVFVLGLPVILMSCGLEDPTFELTTGSIFVVSEPDSASIVLNGSPTGLVTPDSLRLLPVGEHIVQVQRKDYAPTQEALTVAVAAGRSARAEFTLEKTIGNLTVTSAPEQAAVFLDGSDTGETTPAVLTGLALGEHEVQVVLAGYSSDPEFVTAIVLPDDSAAADFTLTQIPGSLAVTSTPNGAAIFVDELDTGETTPATIEGLPVGPHDVRVEMAGYTVEPASVTVTVTSDQVAMAEFTLTAITGNLGVTSTPEGAAILLGGVDSGRTTPAVITGLEPGQYEVALVLDGYLLESFTATVEVGETTTTDIPLLRAKTVLLEGFSNYCCDGCPEMNENLHEVLSLPGYGTDNVLLIKYAVDFPVPSDPHYDANVEDNDARAWGPDYNETGYYGDLFDAVPTLFGDGALMGEPGHPPTAEQLPALVDVLLDREPGFGIRVDAAVAGTEVSATLTMSAPDGMDLSGLTLNAVLVENPIEYEEPPCEGKEELVFHWVMRDFEVVTTSLPVLAAGETAVETVTLTRNVLWPVDHLFVIAFVQNDATREVLQAGSNIPAPGAGSPSSIPVPNNRRYPTQPEGK